MIRYLLVRPIAVIVAFITFIGISIFAFYKLPISLLPNIDVPKIVIKVDLQNASPISIEQNILRPIRENTLSMKHLKDVESVAEKEFGKVSLAFDYGTSMDLAYIEANERIDRLMTFFPKSMSRPQIIRVSTTDIPIARIQIIPSNDGNLLEVSELTEKVIKKRIESITGIGMVEISGIQKKIISITPDYKKVSSLNISFNDINSAIKDLVDVDLGSLSVRDGQYKYLVKLKINKDIEALKNISLRNPSGHYVRLEEVSTIQMEEAEKKGYHLFNNKTGIVITVQKQADSKMNEVMSKLNETVTQFKKDYPKIGFSVTRDQSLLLNMSIDNLKSCLLWGGSLAFFILFLFMGNLKSPIIMGIILPVSLIMTFPLLYVANISLNIISLAGLALGLGMLVDNSIVLIDNLNFKLNQGMGVIDACIVGTKEVMSPLIGSVLTNLAVFIPLVFMDDLTGALFYDQAISIAAILSMSLVATFVLIPLIYFLFHKKKPAIKNYDSFLFTKIKNSYHSGLKIIWKYKILTLIIISCLVPIGLICFILLNVEAFPKIESNETAIHIKWNEHLPLEENKKRVVNLLHKFSKNILSSECEIGVKDFFTQVDNRNLEHAEIYVSCNSDKERQKLDHQLLDFFRKNYPHGSLTISPPTNPFEQIFSKDGSFMEGRFTNTKSYGPIESLKILPLIKDLKNNINLGHHIALGNGLMKENAILIDIDKVVLNFYEISYEEFVNNLKRLMAPMVVSEIKDFGSNIPVVVKSSLGDINEILQMIQIKSDNGNYYPINRLCKISLTSDYKYITADKHGIYQAVAFDSIKNPKRGIKEIKKIGNLNGVNVHFSGHYFENRKNLEKLVLILIFSFVLMYFILTAEFESFLQPLIVIITMPIGIAGSLIFLYFSHGTINIMSAIGIIVTLGVLDNDAILKIDKINTLRKVMPLAQAIEEAGLQRLKPILMTTATNILAVVPIVFSTGIGADMQRPLAITTIGGLVVGTFTALYFVPLLYWYFEIIKNYFYNTMTKLQSDRITR
jgi:multidrug efflux pump subunit AcrB